MAEREITSSVDVTNADGYEMTEADKETVRSLYPKCPKMWDDFRNVTDCVDLMANPSESIETIFNKLMALCPSVERHEARDGQIQDFCCFAVAVGFVDQTVAFYRRTLREMGRTYMTEFDRGPKYKSQKSGCLQIVRSHILNCSLYSVEFCRRLIETGFVNDMVEDLLHAQYLTAEVLDKGHVILYSMGTLDNMCQHPETEAMVREMGLAHVITPFLTKKNEVVKSIAIAVLSHVVRDDELDLMQMDPDLAQYLQRNVREAVSQKKRNTLYWKTEAVLLTLSLLSKCDYNKRLLVALGITETLVSVLDPASERDEVDKQWTLKIFLELVKDQNNLHVFKSNNKVIRAVEGLQTTSNQETKDSVLRLLPYLRRPNDDDTDDMSESPDCPNLTGLLADQFNMLSILGISHAQFVLDQLTTTSLQVSEGSDVTRMKSLQALAELAHKDEKYRREIMTRGALTQLSSSLQGGSDEERCQTMKVILELVFSIENLAIVKSKTDLVSSLFRVSTRHLDGQRPTR